ncbi:unnamed protein product [Agarophyton chilense]
MLLLDGLFDSELDAQLHSLSQYSSKTQVLTQSAALRPKACHPSSHLLPYTRYTLFVPHLKCGWAAVLVDALWRLLRLRLEPLHADVTLAEAPAFYPPLPAYVSHPNEDTLEAIRDSSGSILPRIACYVKLCYVNMLCRSLRDEQEALQRWLSSVEMPDPPKLQLPVPPPRRSRHVIVDAHVVRASSGCVYAYLLGGVLVRTSLYPHVVEILKSYNILVRGPSESIPVAASLCSLSNSASHRVLEKSIPRARGPSHGFVALQTYVKERLATSWTFLCRRVLQHATYLSAEREEKRRSAAISRLTAVLREASAVREQLVQQALRFEMIGKPLTDIAAFAVALYRDNEWERIFEGVSEEHSRDLVNARCKVKQITSLETCDVSTLVQMHKDVGG